MKYKIIGNLSHKNEYKIGKMWNKLELWYKIYNLGVKTKSVNYSFVIREQNQFFVRYSWTMKIPTKWQA